MDRMCSYTSLKSKATVSNLSLKEIE